MSCKQYHCSILLVILLSFASFVEANQPISHVLQKLNSFRRRVIVDVQSALMDQHKTIYQHAQANDTGRRIGVDDCESQFSKLQTATKEREHKLLKLLDEANSNLETALQQLQQKEKSTQAEIQAQVQVEADEWRAKYSRLLKEQSVKAASLEQVKQENAKLKEEMQEMQRNLREVQRLEQELDSLHSVVDAAKIKALENTWIGRQNAESEVTELKAKHHALMEELESLRGNASMTESAKDEALENVWLVLQETIDELGIVQRLADALRLEKEAEKMELQRSFENEINKWRRDYSKLLQYQSTIMTELHQVQADNKFLREELENILGESKTVDAIKSKALENAWVGRENAQNELVLANQLIDAMRKQIESLQDLADQRENEVGQIADAASSLAKLQKAFEVETSSKQAALMERNKELEKNTKKLRKMLEARTMECQAAVKSRVLEAEDKWWKQLSSVRNQKDKSILSAKKEEIDNLNRDIKIMSTEIATLRAENDRLVAQLDDRLSEILLLSSGTESFARAHEDFKSSAERQIDYLTRRVSETQDLLAQKEEYLAGLNQRLSIISKECDARLLDQAFKSNEICEKAVLDCENKSHSQIAAASNATMIAIDAAQQDLRHAYEELYRVTERNKFMEAKLVGQDNQLRSCSNSLEAIMLENAESDKENKLLLQKAISEVDDLKAILHEKNEDLVLLQTTLGEKIDETEMLVEKAAFEAAADVQRSLLQMKRDCQTRCQKAEALDKTQETLRETTSTLEATNNVNKELRESLDHCRMELSQFAETSNMLSKLHDQCQGQAADSARQFEVKIAAIEASATEKIEASAVELLNCRNFLNESENLCSSLLLTSQRNCQVEVESMKISLEQEMVARQASAQLDFDKAAEKADQLLSDCRRDLDRLSVAAQGLSKFQIIVDERAAEVQHSVSAELETIKAELLRKDKQVEHLTRQIGIDSVATADRIRDLEDSCNQKLSWVENSNEVKLQSLEESKDTALLKFQVCSEERTFAQSELARLNSVVAKMSKEMVILDASLQQKVKEAIDMRVQLSQKEELFKSVRVAAVTQHNEMETKCQNAIKDIEQNKDAEINAEREGCREKLTEFSQSCTSMLNKSGGYEIKAVGEYSISQKIWSFFGHESQVYNEQYLQSAIEQRTVEWKRKFQDLEDKSRALLLQTEEALQICHEYSDEKLNNKTIEMKETCQRRLDEQESECVALAKNLTLDLRNAAQERQKVEEAFATATEEMKVLLTDKVQMNKIMTELRSHNAELIKEADMLDEELLEIQQELSQAKIDAAYWREVYEQRRYVNVTHIKEDTEFAVKEATKNIKLLLGTADEFVRSAIPFVLDLVRRMQDTAALLVEQLYQFYDAHLKRNVKELLDFGRETFSQVTILMSQLYDEHMKHNVDQLLDGGRATYNEVAIPLFNKIDREWKALSTKVRLAVGFLVERIAIHLTEICPGLSLLLDIVEKHSDQRLVQGARILLKSSCLNPERTSLNFLKLLGVLVGGLCAILLRRYLLDSLRTIIRVLVWPVQVVTWVVLTPFLFMFRSSFLHRRLFARSAIEDEVHQPDSCGEQSSEIVEENQEEAEVHRPESCDDQSCELTEEDQDEEKRHPADFRE
ncbi:hypothetical protein FisN_3Lh332 [Fistulifera solaris]|uniref:Uncharacterized protein n=1 Tax=Fistulifera solaris TaxID=1519565 RepID=A0A1Z5J863_FISSO|nr:hypothetical protein FisN_3Lh332 [Fistulifera solaris]|eukprot:GAX10139.1 hypothetical protein FisN_3Lh332 [Fistulifera solaris]